VSDPDKTALPSRGPHWCFQAMLLRCGRIRTWRKLNVQLSQNEGDRFLF